MVADRRGLLVWVAVVILILMLGVGSLALIREVERGPRPPFLKADPTQLEALEAHPPSATRLHLAGSGSNLPLTRSLATAFSVEHPDLTITVHESIGSSGGIRAVRDGAIDLGLVSREFDDEAEGEGLEVIPYARVAVVFAAHPSVPVDGLTTQEVLELYSGSRSHWSDGTDVVVFQRETGDSAHVIAGRELMGFAEVDAAAAASGRWRVLFYDQAMQERLMSTEGSVGLFDLGGAVSQDLPIKVLSLDGVAPTEANIVQGRYPLHKPLAFVSRGDHGELAERFVSFVRSATGQSIIRDLGYIPVLASTKPATSPAKPMEDGSSEGSEGEASP
jgi:phosphate transport system substrate-binding protein